MHFPCMASTNPTDLTRLRRQFHALSDETRLRLIDLLRNGECCVCELTDALGAGQSLLSFHLKALKDAGLITDRREGRWSYYALERSVFMEAEELLASLRPKASRSLKIGCC